MVRHRGNYIGLIASQNNTPAPTTYSISGTVYDADGVTAVSGVTVALGALNATSAVDGTFTISSIPAGTSGSMTATKSGYSWAARTILAMSGNLTSQNYINAWWAAGGSGASCVRAYQPIGAASLAASYVNLVTPGTNNATPVSAPTFNASDGWSFDGSNNYLTCGLTPSNDQTYSGLARFSDYNTGSAARCLFGTYTLNFGGFFGILPYVNASRADYNNGGNITNNVGRTSGVIGIAGNKGYYNGAAVAGTIGTGGNTFGQVYIGAENDNPTAASKLNGKIQAIAFYNAALTPTQVAAVSTAMASLP